MAVTDECTLRIIGRYQDQNIVNTMHYRIETQVAGENDILDVLCDAWEAANKTNWLACHIDSYELIGFKAFGKTGTAKVPGVEIDGTAGSVVGDGLPASVCQTITLYTADTKFRRRGRVMLSGTPQGHLDETDGSVTASAIAILNSLGASLIAPVSLAGNEFQAGIPQVGADNWQNFTGYRSRITPSLVKSRRVREFLIG